MAKEIVWALFDSETATVAKALPECEVYGFGKESGKEHIDLDLSDFETAKKVLDTYPKPDVIFASPPCESWTGVSKGNIRLYTTEKGLNFHWKDKFTPFDFNEKAKKTRLNGVNTALTTAKIIQHYKPKFWAIENGTQSLIFSYLYYKANLDGIKNICNYFSYGFLVYKPTVIYSNIRLFLHNRKPDFTKIKNVISRRTKKANERDKRNGIKTLNNYKDRSLVPPALYQDIMRQFRHGGQPVLFSDSDYKAKEAV